MQVDRIKRDIVLDGFDACLIQILRDICEELAHIRLGVYEIAQALQ